MMLLTNIDGIMHRMVDIKPPAFTEHLTSFSVLQYGFTGSERACDIPRDNANFFHSVQEARTHAS